MVSSAIDCVLFDMCNLNCKHCFQQHNVFKFNKDKIDEFVYHIDKTIGDDIKTKSISTVLLSLRGGELFQDGLGDDVFSLYKQMIENINFLCKTKYPLLNIKYHFMTNGIYNKIDRVVDFIQSVNGVMTLSYDPIGRFKTDKQLELFYRNYEILKEKKLIKNIAITLTKDSIIEYIKNKNLLKQFYQTDIDINYYIPTMNGFDLPSDDDIFDFYKFLLDNNIFNVLYVQNILNSYIYGTPIGPICLCDNTTIIYNNKSYRSCNVYIPNYKLSDFYDDTNIKDLDAVESIKKQGLKKRNCIMCEYYKNCSYYCWMMLCYRKFKMSECPHKRIYKYIENNSKIIENFKIWKNTNDIK